MIKMLLDRATKVGEISRSYTKLQADLILLVHYLHNAVGYNEDLRKEILAVGYGVPDDGVITIICRDKEDVEKVLKDLTTNAHLTYVQKLCEIGTQSLEIPFFRGRTNDFGTYPNFYVMDDPTFGEIMVIKGGTKIRF